MVARARGCDTGVEQGVAVRVWVVTEEWGYANIWRLRGVFSSLENAIADRREFYNESVNVNNVRIEQFPDSIVAGTFSFKAAQLLEFSAEEKADVDVGKLFKAG